MTVLRESVRGLEQKRFISLFVVVLLSACATVPKPDVKVIDKKPKISKTIAEELPRAKKGLKRKIAIARFTNETRYGQSFFLDENNDRIGKQAVDILSAKLMQTEKFIMLERADLDKVYKELKIGNAESLKNMADFLIIGSITEFGRKDQSKVGFFSRTKRQESYAKVHIRLIDVYTSQVLYSEEGAGTAFSETGTVLGMGGRAGYDSTLNDKVLDAAISNLANNIIENLLNKPWRGYVLGHADGKLIISGGKSQNIEPDDIFEIVLEGEKIKNPQTNMFITLPGKKIGKIKVLLSQGDTPANEVSFCEIIDGDLSEYIASKEFSRIYIRENK